MRKINLSFTTIKRFIDPLGNVHGGFIVAMLDETMGSTVIGVTDAACFTKTISMIIDFIHPIQPGTVFGEEKITSMGENITFLEANLTNEAGTVLARSTASYKLLAFDKEIIQKNIDRSQ